MDQRRRLKRLHRDGRASQVVRRQPAHLMANGFDQRFERGPIALTDRAKEPADATLVVETTLCAQKNLDS